MGTTPCLTALVGESRGRALPRVPGAPSPLLLCPTAPCGCPPTHTTTRGRLARPTGLLPLRLVLVLVLGTAMQAGLGRPTTPSSTTWWRAWLRVLQGLRRLQLRRGTSLVHQVSLMRPARVCRHWMWPLVHQLHSWRPPFCVMCGVTSLGQWTRLGGPWLPSPRLPPRPVLSPRQRACDSEVAWALPLPGWVSRPASQQQRAVRTQPLGPCPAVVPLALGSPPL